jgi:hypothetical protein
MPPTGEEPPAEVADAARDRGFGPRVASRKLANPLVVAGVSLAVAVLALVLMMIFGALHPPTHGVLYPVMRFVALFLCFGFVGALVYGIAALVRGAQSFHVYAGGFVHRRNGKVRAVAWPDVAQLTPATGKRGDNTGKLLHYQLVLRDGSTIAVPLVIVDGRDEFIDHLMAALRGSGIPVH